ncbi:hypothetical protein [Heyndrickxia ginsengihumi]|uniref:hypothetical protein n=1 Tax=Heyndrickxia ginsengihumi TaxID=363870 RepID=UPI00046E6825|nr:hypothetical protein [Heyndrickxia ginsengihumi]
MRVKKSNLFEGAYQIEGLSGHYYLKNSKEVQFLGVARIERMIFEGSEWCKEDIHLKLSKYRKIMKELNKID